MLVFIIQLIQIRSMNYFRFESIDTNIPFVSSAYKKYNLNNNVAQVITVDQTPNLKFNFL